MDVVSLVCRWASPAYYETLCQKVLALHALPARSPRIFYSRGNHRLRPQGDQLVAFRERAHSFGLSHRHRHHYRLFVRVSDGSNDAPLSRRQALVGEGTS